MCSPSAADRTGCGRAKDGALVLTQGWNWWPSNAWGQRVEQSEANQHGARPAPFGFAYSGTAHDRSSSRWPGQCGIVGIGGVAKAVITPFPILKFPIGQNAFENKPSSESVHALPRVRWPLHTKYDSTQHLHHCALVLSPGRYLATWRVATAARWQPCSMDRLRPRPERFYIHFTSHILRKTEKCQTVLRKNVKFYARL
jgi:hypothetical protein